MNISPSKLAAATAIVSRQSIVSPFTGPFVDMFQVPQGKVGRTGAEGAQGKTGATGATGAQGEHG